MSLPAGPIGVVCYGALAVVVLLWLVISFTPAGAGRAVLEWLAATHLYASLGSFFLWLVLEARAEDHLLREIAFGFFVLIFVLGFCVSLVNTLRAMSGPPRSGSDSATG